MIALVQRVQSARVTVEGETVGAIGKGLLLLLGVHVDDGIDELGWVTRKCANLRIFPDEEGRMNRSVTDVNGEVLVVSQFTLYGDTQKGNRPSFVQSAAPEKAEALYTTFVEEIARLIDKPVPTGLFGAMMQVHLVNDGPVTLWIERNAREA
jgi:D-tyrosyl-tRNA(Tyr) deacylase